jgi:hypothetical protein
MHVSLFRSIARSLPTLALALSIATTPAVAGLRAGGEGVSMAAVEASMAALVAEASIQASAMEGSAWAIEGSVAVSSTEGSAAVSATDSLMATSTPITPVITIVATATTDTPATATASPISRLCAGAAKLLVLQHGSAKLIVARGSAERNIQIVRRATPITRRAENQTAARVWFTRPVHPKLFVGRAEV